MKNELVRKARVAYEKAVIEACKIRNQKVEQANKEKETTIDKAHDEFLKVRASSAK